MTSFVSIAVVVIVAICIALTRAAPNPQVITIPPLPPQPQQGSENLGEQIGQFVDQMVQHGKDTIQKFIPQGTKGVAMQGPPSSGMGIPPPGGPQGGPPTPAVHPASGLVGDKDAAHGFAGHFHDAACRNITN